MDDEHGESILGNVNDVTWQSPLFIKNSMEIGKNYNKITIKFVLLEEYIKGRIYKFSRNMSLDILLFLKNSMEIETS